MKYKLFVGCLLVLLSCSIAPNLTAQSPQPTVYPVRGDAMVVGDFNGDGKPDVAVASLCGLAGCGGPGAVAILLNNGDGTFRSAGTYSTVSFDFRCDAGAAAMVGGTFIGGNASELAVSTIACGTVGGFPDLGLLPGKGDGTFPSVIPFSSGSPAWSMAVGDFNGDGKLDLAVGEGCFNSGCARVGIFLGNGDGTFQTEMSFPVGTSSTNFANSIVVGDFNGDGKPDLAVSTDDSKVSIFLGNGGGTFSLSQTFTARGSIAVGDVNRDGKADLAVGTLGLCTTVFNCNPTVTIFLGNGDGTFLSLPTFPVGGGTSASLALGDLNGDGKQDLVVGSAFVMLGNGDGTFQTATKYSFGLGATVVAIADLNGDGFQDIVTFDKHSVSVFLGNGDGTLLANTPVGANVVVQPVDQTTHTSPVTLTFSNVTQAGTTSLVTSTTGPILPTGFQLAGVYYNLATTAQFTGNITICITSPAVTSSSQLWHFGSSGSVDVTSLPVIQPTICGLVSSLSPFAILQPGSSTVATTTSITAPTVTYGSPASAAVSVSSSGGTVSGSVTLIVDGGTASLMALSNGSAVFNLGVLNASNHTLSASFAGLGNFQASSSVGSLTVAPAPLTVTAINASRPYGAANPAAFSVNFGGFVNNEGSSVLAGLLNCAPLATSNSPVGMYPIMCSGLSSPNYAISFINGTLNVVPETTSLNVTISPTSIAVGQSTTVTVTLTAPDMVIAIDPTVLASVAVTSPMFISDILTGNGVCALAPAGIGVAACSVTLTAVEPNGRTLLASFPGTSALVASTNTAGLIVTASLESKVSCLKSDFRNVAVPGGSYLWFNSMFKVRDVTKQKVTITFFKSNVQFQYTDASKNLVSVNQPLPDAKIVIDPSVITASTAFDSVNNVWITTVPFDLDDAMFLTGIPWLVPAGGTPGDIEPVTWCGTFASDTAGVEMGWRWSAAAYSSFSGNNAVLGVKPMNTDHDNPPVNRDNAGTPEYFKPSLIPGARGKGGKNYTGSYSGSAEIE